MYCILLNLYVIRQYILSFLKKMFFFIVQKNNFGTYCTNFSLYKFLYQKNFKELFLLVKSSNKNTQIISIIIIAGNNIIWLSHNEFTLSQSYSAVILYLYIMSSYSQRISLLLEVYCLNYKGLSLYIWLGYNILRQKIFYYNQKLNYQYALKNNKKKQKIFGDD